MSTSKTAVMAFGRYNPPTKEGHGKVFDKVAEVAKRTGGTGHIVASHTEGTAKDPLPQSKKIGYIKKMAPKGVNVSGSSREHPSIFHHAAKLHAAGHDHLVVVAGSDRVDEYKAALNKYNGVKGKHGFYNYKKIDVESSGDRDADKEGAEGMSASKVRAHARAGNFKEFKSALHPSLHPHAKEMYDQIRSVKEDNENSYTEGTDMNEYYSAIATEEVANIPPELKTPSKKPITKTATEAKEMKDNDLEDLVKNMSDNDLEKHIDMHYDDVMDEDEDEDEDEVKEVRAPLTLQQRLKRARTLRRFQPKLQRMRMVKRNRMADPGTLMRRARKLAVLLLKRRVAGKRGLDYRKLSASEKISIDRLVAPRLSLVGKIAQRLLPIIRRKELARLKRARGQGSSPAIQTPTVAAEYTPEATEVPQDQDIAGRKGTQPAKYFSGLGKSTKVARDRQFKKQTKMSSTNPSAYKAAPGDKEADTIPSAYTAKYKSIFGEDLDNQFEGYLKENVEINTFKKFVTFTENENINELFSNFMDKKSSLDEKEIAALRKKSDKSGVSYGTLKKVYDRGMAAWRTGHRPGTTPQQWAFARVNSFITGGKTRQTADKDLADDVDVWHLEATRKALSGIREQYDLIFETKSAPKGYHFTRSGQLKKGDADVDGDGGEKLRSDPLDKLRKKIPPLPEGMSKAQQAAISISKMKKAGTFKEEQETLNNALNQIQEAIDDEGKMARGQLMLIIKNARALVGKMSDNKQLDGWIQSKLTKAADYLDSVHDYLMNNKQDVDEVKEQDHVKRTQDMIKREKESNKERHDRMMDTARLRDVRAKNMATEAEDEKKSADYKIEIGPDGKERKVRSHSIAFQKEGNGLWANIHKKRKEGRPMREPGSKGAPTKQDFKSASEDFKLNRLGSNPGKFKRLVSKHLGAKAAEKIGASDGERIMAKAKRSDNKQLFRQGSFIKNFYGKTNEEKDLNESFDMFVAKPTGIGTLLTATDLGMKIQGEYAHHISVCDIEEDDEYYGFTEEEFEVTGNEEYEEGWEEIILEAEYQGRKVTLGKPFLTPDGPKKRSVYVTNEKGNVVKVNFGDPNMTIKKSNPDRRRSFRARHNCENPGPRWMARYWSCKAW